MENGFVRTSDGAYVYYESEGSGQPLVLVHGWGCSTRFYARNVAGLKDSFRVVTVDLRGHGRSSKGSDGYTLDRLAKDLHEVIVALGLENVLLMGWSLGGPTMLAYWKQFGKEEGRLAGLGLIDMTPYPFSGEPWNSHSLRGCNADGFNAFVRAYTGSRDKFTDAFLANIMPDRKLPAEDAWMKEEALKVPVWAGVALYGDYCYTDYTDVLPTITVPVIVFSADSGIFPRSIEQGRAIAAMIPRATFVPFEKGGHALFYYEAEKFNQAVRDFARKAKAS